MKKIYFLLLFIFSLLYSAFSNTLQQTDSLLLQVKNAKEDTAKVNTLNALAFEFRNNDPDTSLYYSDESLELATKLNYKMGIGDAYLQKSNALMNLGEYDEALKNGNDALKIYEQLLATVKSADKSPIFKQKARTNNSIGIIYWYQGNYPEALKNHFAALKIRKELRDKKGIAISSNNLGLVYGNQGNYPEALKNYFAALQILEETGDKYSLAASYVNIGIIYRNQYNFPEALKYNFDALKIQEELGDEKGIANSFHNIGAIYDDQGKYPEALEKYLVSLKISEKLKDQNGIAQSYNNIGLIYWYQGNYPQALMNLFASLKIKETMGDKGGIVESYNNIGSVYLKQKKIRMAFQYLNKALSLAKEIGSKEDIKISYCSLAELDSVQGNFKKALEYYKLFITYRDSLFNEENTIQSVQLQMQYNFDKKDIVAKVEQEKKDIIAQQQIQKQKLIRNSFIAGSILLVLLIIVLYNRNKLKRTVEMEKMRNRLSRDLHDDIGSTLSSINILSRTAQSNLNQADEKTKASLEKINERSQRLLDNMSDIIWNINPGNDTIEEVMSRMREYATSILEAKNIDYTFNFPKEKMDCKLSMEVKNNMYLIFKEAVNNLSKYSGGTNVNLSLIFDEKNIHLKIQDNGIGFNQDEIKHRGGLSNMQHRAEEIKGLIKINSEPGKGTDVELTMPRYC